MSLQRALGRLLVFSLLPVFFDGRARRFPFPFCFVSAYLAILFCVFSYQLTPAVTFAGVLAKLAPAECSLRQEFTEAKLFLHVHFFNAPKLTSSHGVFGMRGPSSFSRLDWLFERVLVRCTNRFPKSLIDIHFMFC